MSDSSWGVCAPRQTSAVDAAMSNIHAWIASAVRDQRERDAALVEACARLPNGSLDGKLLVLARRIREGVTP